MVDLTKIISRNYEVKWDDIVFIDDVIGVNETYGVKVFTFEELKKEFKPDEIEIIITVGDPSSREMMYNRVKEAGYKLGTWIDPRADVADSVEIGEGVIITNSFIGSNIIIGDNSVISNMAMVGHDIVIGKHVNVSAGAFIGGHCNIGDKAFIGPKAALKDSLNIGAEAVIGLNAAVYKDVPDGMLAFGNPARNLTREKSDKLF